MDRHWQEQGQRRRCHSRGQEDDVDVVDGILKTKGNRVDVVCGKDVQVEEKVVNEMEMMMMIVQVVVACRLELYDAEDPGLWSLSEIEKTSENWTEEESVREIGEPFDWR